MNACFLLDAVTYLVAAACNYRLRVRPIAMTKGSTRIIDRVASEHKQKHYSAMPHKWATGLEVRLNSLRLTHSGINFLEVLTPMHGSESYSESYKDPTGSLAV